MKIKAYTKSEFAMLYFPDCDPHVARVRMSSWIRRCTELQKRIEACRSSKFAKYYTAKEVALILEYLGSPDGT